jgi:NitT/TauT family transport system substrate-binding protein
VLTTPPPARTQRRTLRVVLGLLAASVLVLGACSSDDDSSEGSDGGTEDSTGSGEEAGGATADTLRLGYFANVTHAPALVGVEEGTFEDALGDTTLETSTFNSGTEASEALLSGAIDATFIGPNPAINAFAQSDGAVVLVSGSTSGGASLVVNPDITSPEDLEGTTIASPDLGNTQDVALRTWLGEQGYETDTSGGGDVSVSPQENADSLRLFQEGTIDGAWVPEPWATRLIQEGGGETLVDEGELWPDGQYVTTHLLVSREFLDQYPGTVQDLIEGELAALELIESDPEAAQTATNDGIEAITTERIPDEVISAAWENLEFTADPIASSLQTSKDDAVALGLLDEVDLDGIYDLSILNQVLADAGEPEVEGL